ncbi:MAG: NAD+ synthase [Thermoleophilia bacterium]
MALAQLNTVVGDIAGNVEQIHRSLEAAASAEADLVVFPELTVAGYPPEDLLLRPRFARACEAAVDRVAREVGDFVAIVGFPLWDRDLYNAAAVLSGGSRRAVYRKRFLPNYGVFDEARYFRAGSRPLVLEFCGLRVGLTICEDIWYPTPVVSDLAAAGVDVIACLSASPWHRDKGDARERMLCTRAADAGAALAFCNQVGGQDELVFDGRSLVCDAGGITVARAPEFLESLVVCDIDRQLAERRRLREPLGRRLEPGATPELVALDVTVTPRFGAGATCVPPLDESEEVWRGLVTGIRDYVVKNGFGGVVIGLSGGIDSALTAALAVDALGPERVMGVTMPSRYTSDRSNDDASRLADLLGIRFATIPIADTVASFEAALAPVFEDAERDVTEENLQARTRGTLLMGISNKHGDLVLATGNKSEMSVGYSTLYGDMVGGFAPLRDISKTWVYRLARWRNDHAEREVIPESTIERPPTAELRPDQLDTDSLPPYDILDPIIEGYVESEFDVDDLVAMGHDEDTVRRVIRMIDRAEYKRRQGPVGIKATPRAFGKDRRMPITNGHVA